MIAEQLKKFFDPFVYLNIQVWENFEKLGEVQNFSKETVLKASNTKERYFYSQITCDMIKRNQLKQFRPGLNQVIITFCRT